MEKLLNYTILFRTSLYVILAWERKINSEEKIILIIEIISSKIVNYFWF